MSVVRNVVGLVMATATCAWMSDPASAACSSPAGVEGEMRYFSGDQAYKYCEGTDWSPMGGSMPAGAIAPFEMSSCPPGWAEYTPAYGRFIRGIDKSGSNIDPAGQRPAGNTQGDAMRRLEGLYDGNFISSQPGNGDGVFANSGIQQTVNQYDYQAGTYWGAEIDFDNANVTPTAPENRPKNVALLYCEKQLDVDAVAGSSIDGLADVDTTTHGATVGDGLIYDGSNWVPTTAAGTPTMEMTTSGIAFDEDGDNDWAGIGELNGGLALSGAFSASSTPHVVVDSNGRLGVGTQTPNAVAEVQGIRATPDKPVLRVESPVTGAPINMIQLSDGVDHTAYFGVDPDSGYAYLGASQSKDLTLNSGKVGIGAVNYQDGLFIKRDNGLLLENESIARASGGASARVLGNSQIASLAANQYWNGASVVAARAGRASSIEIAWPGGNNASGDIRFEVNQNDLAAGENVANGRKVAMVVDGDTGHLGLGTNDPGRSISIVDHGPAIWMQDANDTGASAVTYIDWRDANGDRTGYVGDGSGGNGNIYVKSSNGDVYAGGVSNTCNITAGGCSSDRRLKREIDPVSDSLDRLSQIDGVTYRWRPDNPEGYDAEPEHHGFVAQDVENAFPGLVKEGDDGWKTVNYRGILPHLVEALKQLRAEKNEEMAALKARVRALEKRLRAQDR